MGGYHGADGDDGLDTTVDCAGFDGVATRKTVAPDSDLGSVDLGCVGEEGHGFVVVYGLLVGIGFLAREAVTRAKVSVVKDQGGNASCLELFGDEVEAHLFHA